MKITNFFKRTMLLVVMILTTLYTNAIYYGGTITIKVGETYFVNADFGGGLTQTGSWSKSNSTFTFVSRSSKSCTIRGEQVGTGTLYYNGVAGAYDADTYWTVNVVSDGGGNQNNLTLTATPAGGTVEKGTKVRLIASNASAIIVYTLDGSDPMTSSTKQAIPSDYSNGPVINESCTLKAYAEYINCSDVYTWNYTVSPSKSIAIDAINFPDANFRNYLLEQSYGKDRVLTEEEIKGIISINVSEKKISSLKGIEHFISLKYLYCQNNQLTTLDVSNNTALKSLDCYSNQLTTLDVSKNTALTSLYCYDNQLTTLDVSKNTALTSLYCYDNQLTALDVSKNTALTFLYCRDNQLTALDVSKNTALTYLYCYNNQLTTLDVSNNTALTYLYCYDNQLTTLDVSNNTALTYLYCSGNQLTALDVSKDTALTYLSCGSNQLTALDVSENTALTSLSCGSNQLTALDVSKNTALTFLSCGSNQLTALDVSKNTALTSLSCAFNQLALLDVSKNTALTSLYCSHNQLTALDLSKNTALTNLVCHKNQIKGTLMDALISSLPQNNTNEKYIFRVIYFDAEGKEDGNVCTKEQVAAAKAKGWTPEYYNGTEYVEYEGSDDEPIQNIAIDETNFPDADFRNWLLNQEYGKDGNLTTVEIDEITHINVYNKNIRSLKGLEYFTALIGLNCRHNQLTSLDISMNTALTRLDCSDNQLTNLDVSNNIALTTIECYCNQIKKEAMDALISSLPQNTTSNEYVFCVVDDARYYDSKLDNICTKTQVSAAKAKGWIVTDAQWVVYEGSDDEPTKGTADNPFTPAEAYAYGSTLAANEQSQEDYYIRGMVVSVKEQFGTQYGNATFYISADGTEKDQFYIYRALYLENTKYTGQDQLLRVGDDVVVCGKITNYMGTLPETVQEKAYVVSINGNTSGINDVMIDGNEAAPIYNLNGQRVNTTKKGLYIINGKKVVVR